MVAIAHDTETYMLWRQPIAICERRWSSGSSAMISTSASILFEIRLPPLRQRRDDKSGINREIAHFGSLHGRRRLV